MSNPVLDPQKFESNNVYAEAGVMGSVDTMSIDGTLQITGVLGLILAACAYLCWSRFSLGYTDIGVMLTGAGAIAGFILALVICFMSNSASVRFIKYLAPMYAACEGLFLGGISASFEASYPGIISQAIAGTFAALFTMLILYRFNIITCTQKFRSVIIISTISIAAVYLIDIIGHFFGYAVPVINSSSPIGILVSAVIVVIASLNLIIDFDFIERGAGNLPKDFEWYGAFGLMVTVVWMYVEILKLLSKLQRR